MLSKSDFRLSRLGGVRQAVVDGDAIENATASLLSRMLHEMESLKLR
jgi:hypothetical protein